MVMADDEEREYVDAAGAEAKKAEYEALGLEIISMRDDFGTIYGKKVVLHVFLGKGPKKGLQKEHRRLLIVVATQTRRKSSYAPGRGYLN